MILEICANSYQSAINAEKSGAKRIELCSELSIGGITPSYGLLQKVIKKLSIPVHVLIRPRSGDFSYSKEEFDVMKEDILVCKKLGVSGIVSGVLLHNNTIDLERTKELIDLSKPLSFTFHRAFDWVKSPKIEIKNLEKIGVERILSSGLETTAEKGIELLKELKETSSVSIMPGGGIHHKNVLLFKNAGFNEIHLSASKQIKTIEIPKVSMNNYHYFDETKTTVSDANTIKKIISLINE